ncbi:ATP-binding protein [Frankia gtarii]|uniref:ATP-binding protein n=1 Tax=Frankia gtarii TaxID=2950102 RepID=UPI0021BE2D87|nr:ATP-binding protein [Frankia gtarii]
MTLAGFGYIRRSDGDEEEINRLYDVLTAYASCEGLALVEVYVDRHTPSDQLIRPGLSVLLSAIRHYDRTVVLVASPAHLSTSPPTRRALAAEIADSGGVVQVVPPPRPRSQLSAGVRIFRFPADTAAARAARTCTRHTLGDWHLDDETTETALLLVSELITNAVTASASSPDAPAVDGRQNATGSGGSFVALRLSMFGERLVLEIWDRDDRPPLLQDQNLAAEGGRGLVLVSALSSRWSFYPTREGGKVVWCEFPAELRPEHHSSATYLAAEALPRRTPHTGEGAEVAALPVPSVDDPAFLQRVVDGLRALDNWHLPADRAVSPPDVEGRGAGWAPGGIQ